MMPFMTRNELRWSRYISISNAIGKVDYREVEHYLTITRCYAIHGDIDGDCPGSVSHSARLAPRNLPVRHENRNRGFSDKKLLQRRVRNFWNFDFQKFDL